MGLPNMDEKDNIARADDIIETLKPYIGEPAPKIRTKYSASDRLTVQDIRDAHDYLTRRALQHAATAFKLSEMRDKQYAVIHPFVAYDIVTEEIS